MMELIYMTFTNLTLDEAEYEAIQKMLAGVLANQEKDPRFVFQRDLLKTLYSNPRKQIITTEILNAAKREPIVKIAHDATANAADYTFFFVGSIDMETLRPLLEQYIATLPADAKTANKSYELNKSLEMAQGTKVDNFTTAMQTPQTYVAIIASADVPYTAKERNIASIAGQILSNRLLHTVREDMGAVYSIGASGSLSRIGTPNTLMQTTFPMKPEMKDQVLEFIANEFKAMESNITAEEVSKAVEYMVKNANEDRELNRPWISAMVATELNGVDTFNGIVDVLNSITVDDIQNYMKALNASGNYRTVILEAEATEAAE